MLLIPQPASGSATQSKSRKLRRSGWITPTPARPRRGGGGRSCRSVTSPPPLRGRVREGGAPDLISAALDIRIDMGLPLAAGMGDGPLFRIADGLSITPEGARLIVVAPRLPGPAALGELA